VVHNFPDFIRIKCFTCVFAILGHFRCGFISADSFVVPNMLSDPFLNFSTFPPSFKSFNQFVNFLLAHTVTIILNYQFSLNFNTSYTLWSQKSVHRPLFFMQRTHKDQCIKNNCNSLYLQRLWKLNFYIFSQIFR